MNGVQTIEELNRKAAYRKNHPITRSEQLPNPLAWEPMTEERRERLEERNFFWYTEYRGRLEYDCRGDEKQVAHIRDILQLRDRLLTFGGEQASMPNSEPDLHAMMTRGQFWYGDNAVLMKGEPSQCHRNSAYLWEANQGQVVLATGYALTSDGIWRQHSWCVQIRPRKNRVVETTVPRIAYYGFVMTEEEAGKFLYQND